MSKNVHGEFEDKFDENERQKKNNNPQMYEELNFDCNT